jgi:hypothetical protein
VLGATVGVAGGILLGRSRNRNRSKLFGIEVPKKVDFAGVSQQIGEAGRQFGRLAREVRTVREKAERVGRALD